MIDGSGPSGIAWRGSLRDINVGRGAVFMNNVGSQRDRLSQASRGGEGTKKIQIEN